MVNSKKMSKSKVAIILLSLLLCLSMILTATGAWFTDSANGAGNDTFTFGTVDVNIENGDVVVSRTECKQVLVVDHCSWEATAEYANDSDVAILYTVSYSFKLYKDDVEVLDPTILGYFDGIATAQAATLKGCATGAEDTITPMTITFDSKGAMNGVAGSYKIELTLEVKAMQADHVSTPADVLAGLGITVTQEQVTAALAQAYPEA